MDSPQFAISVVSALHIGLRLWHPWWHPLPGAVFASPSKLIKEVKRIGYDGVQAIPIWDLTGREEGILISQGPWNAVNSFLEAMQGKPGTLEVESKPEDWVVSPPPAECNKVIEQLIARDIPRIYHNFDDEPKTTKKYIEVHPGLGMTATEIFDLCQKKDMEVVIDFRHLRRGVLRHEVALKPNLVVGESSLGRNLAGWIKTIDTLARLVKVVHVQPIGQEELEKFQAEPEKTQLGVLLSHTLSKCDVDIMVAEYNPGKKALVNPSASRKIADNYLVSMQKITGE